MHLRALAASLVAAFLLVGANATAADPPNFDFYGYAEVPAAIGQPFAMRSVLTNNGVVPTPIVLDFATNQYTLVVTATAGPTVGIAQHLVAALIWIYSDPIGSGTAADYSNSGTFTDGTLILSGGFDGDLIRNTFTSTLGNFHGGVNFSGGTRLGDLGSPNGWPFGGGWSRSVSGIPVGYQENWDGKIDLPSVASEPRSWNGVKSLYR